MGDVIVGQFQKPKPQATEPASTEPTPVNQAVWEMCDYMRLTSGATDGCQRCMPKPSAGGERQAPCYCLASGAIRIAWEWRDFPNGHQHRQG